MDGNRLVRLVTLVEVIALQHARHGVLRRKPDEVCRTELIHPGGIECHLGLGRIQNLEDLCFIGLGVVEHLLARKRGTGSTLAARIANHAGEVADQENHLMPEILELAQLVNKHRVSKVQVGRGWIKTGLDAKWLPTLELCDQLGLDQEFICTTLDQR